MENNHHPSIIMTLISTIIIAVSPRILSESQANHKDINMLHNSTLMINDSSVNKIDPIFKLNDSVVSSSLSMESSQENPLSSGQSFNLYRLSTKVKGSNDPIEEIRKKKAEQRKELAKNKISQRITDTLRIAQMLRDQKHEQEDGMMTLDVNPKFHYCKRNLINSYLVTPNYSLKNSAKLDFIDKITNYSIDETEYKMFQLKREKSVGHKESKVDAKLNYDVDKMNEKLKDLAGSLHVEPEEETRFYCPQIQRSCCEDAQMVELIQKYYNAKTYLLIFKKQLILLFDIVGKISRHDFNNLNNRFDLSLSKNFSKKCNVLSKGEMIRKLHNIQAVDNKRFVDVYFEKLLGKYYSFACSLCNADKHSSFKNRRSKDDIFTSILRISKQTCVNYMETNKSKFEFYTSLQNLFKIINSLNCIKEGEPVIDTFFEVDSSKQYVSYYDECMNYFQQEDNPEMNQNFTFRIKKFKCLAICQKFFKINYWKNTYGLKNSIFEALMKIQEFLRDYRDEEQIDLHKYRNQQKLNKLLNEKVDAGKFNRVYFYSKIDRKDFNFDDFYGIEISQDHGVDLFKEKLFFHNSASWISFLGVWVLFVVFL